MLSDLEPYKFTLKSVIVLKRFFHTKLLGNIIGLTFANTKIEPQHIKLNTACRVEMYTTSSRPYQSIELTAQS